MPTLPLTLSQTVGNYNLFYASVMQCDPRHFRCLLDMEKDCWQSAWHSGNRRPIGTGRLVIVIETYTHKFLVIGCLLRPTMHPHRGSLFIYTLALLSVYVYPSSAAVGHGHHAAPLVQLNESEVTMYHSPTPPSYWSIDIDNIDSDTSRHPGLMAFHGVLMALAFFIALPLCE